LNRVRERYMEYFKEGCLHNVKPYPGIVEALRELKKQGAKLAVLSNKPDANTKNVIRTVFPEDGLLTGCRDSPGHSRENPIRQALSTSRSSSA